MANKLIKDLTTLGTGNVENEDWLEIQEDDSTVSKKITVEVLTEIERAARESQDNTIEAACGLDADGTYPGFSGTNVLDSTTDIVDALDALDNAIGGNTGIWVNDVYISSADTYTLGVTPYEIVAAPGSNKHLDIIYCSISLQFTSVAMEVGSQKLVLEYDTGTSPIMEWSNAFIESGSSVINKGTWTSQTEILTNKKLQLTYDSGNNATAGNSSLYVHIVYAQRTSIYTAP